MHFDCSLMIYREIKSATVRKLNLSQVSDLDDSVFCENFISPLYYFKIEDERSKIQVRIKPVEESKGSNSDLSEEQLKKLSATLTLMSPASMVRQ